MNSLANDFISLKLFIFNWDFLWIVLNVERKHANDQTKW